jgi:hypothetical protein
MLGGLMDRRDAELAQSLRVFGCCELEMLDAMALAWLSVLLEGVDGVVDGLVADGVESALKACVACFLDDWIEHLGCPDWALEVRVGSVRFREGGCACVDNAVADDLDAYDSEIWTLVLVELLAELDGSLYLLQAVLLAVSRVHNPVGCHAHWHGTALSFAEREDGFPCVLIHGHVDTTGGSYRVIGFDGSP